MGIWPFSKVNLGPVIFFFKILFRIFLSEALVLWNNWTYDVDMFKCQYAILEQLRWIMPLTQTYYFWPKFFLIFRSGHKEVPVTNLMITRQLPVRLLCLTDYCKLLTIYHSVKSLILILQCFKDKWLGTIGPSIIT